MILINLIKRLRIDKEMSQSQLAEACGVSQGAVAQWENDLCLPKSSRIKTVARVLNCDVSVLLQMAEQKQNDLGA